MKYIHKTGLLRPFLPIAFFLACSLSLYSTKAYAGSYYLTARAADGSHGIQADGSSLFDSREWVPGDAREADITIANEDTAPLYSHWSIRSSSDGRLYESLQLRVYSTEHDLLYEGKVRDFNMLTGPYQKGEKKSYRLELSLPKELSNDISGQSVRFDLSFLFGDTPDFRAEAPEKIPALSKGSHGTGIGPGLFYHAELQCLVDAYGKPVFYTWVDSAGLRAPKTRPLCPDDNNLTAVTKGQVYPRPQSLLHDGIRGGGWEKHEDPAAKAAFWKYRLQDGGYLQGGFALVETSSEAAHPRYGWYYFDPEGRMAVGWILTGETHWFYAHDQEDGDLGILETGWIEDAEDKALYYMSETNGEMMSGWLQLIGSKDSSSKNEYYFAALEDTIRQNWFYQTSVGRWLYDHMGGRSYGSMYRDEKTPDGHSVGPDGARTDYGNHDADR